MIKHSEKHLANISNNITRVKEYSDSLSKLMCDDSRVFWSALKYIIEKSKEGHREMMFSVLGRKEYGHPGTVLGEAKFHAGNIEAYQQIVDIVEKNDEAIAEASARIVELKNEKKEIESNIDAQ